MSNNSITTHPRMNLSISESSSSPSLPIDHDYSSSSHEGEQDGPEEGEMSAAANALVESAEMECDHCEIDQPMEVHATESRVQDHPLSDSVGNNEETTVEIITENEQAVFPMVVDDDDAENGNDDAELSGNNDAELSGNDDAETSGNDDAVTSGNDDAVTSGNDDAETSGNDDAETSGNTVGGDESSQENDTKAPIGTDCPVCLDSIQSTRILRTVECDHSICRDCFRDYCHHCIALHQVPIPCFVAECDQVLDDDLVLMSVVDTEASESSSLPALTNRSKENESSLSPSEDDLVAVDEKSTDQSTNVPILSEFYRKKYQRLMSLKNNPTSVECTRCSEVVPQPPLEYLHTPGSSVAPKFMRLNNERTCAACGHHFCAVHGDAHLGMRCFDYDPPSDDLEALGAALLEQDPSSLAPQNDEGENDDNNNAKRKIRKFIKPCSHCGALLHKYEGCNLVVCPACDKTMCFQCGRHDMLQGEGFTKYCKACRSFYVDERGSGASGCERCCLVLAVPVVVPMILLYISLVLVYSFVCMVLQKLARLVCRGRDVFGCCSRAYQRVSTGTHQMEVPAAVMYMIIASLFTILSCCCCGCFSCGRSLPDPSQSSPPADVEAGPFEQEAASSLGLQDPPQTKKRMSSYPLFRGVAYVTFITFLPLVVLVRETGWRPAILEDFVAAFFSPAENRLPDEEAAYNTMISSVLNGSTSTPDNQLA